MSHYDYLHPYFLDGKLKCQVDYINYPKLQKLYKINKWWIWT